MTQKQALNILKMGFNVFLGGPPGSGKTFLLKKYIEFLRNKGKDVAVTASTGIAATHLGGTTIHSWSGLGIKDTLTTQDLKKLLKKKYLRSHFRKTQVLIIDEVSMLQACQFDSLNYICQTFKKQSKPFGGMQIVCSGDFFQLPPVSKKEPARFITESQIWSRMNIKVCYLTEQHRQKNNDLLEILRLIRSRQPEKARRLLKSSPQKTSFSIKPARLYTHNKDVDVINRNRLAKIKSKKFVYSMKNYGPHGLVNSLKRNCLAVPKLGLKKGAKVMFIKNGFGQGYVNGTLGQIVDFNKRKMPVVKTLKGRHVSVKPVSWTIEQEAEVKAQIRQLPLRLAWAITVHKSQGMNLEAARINLAKSFLRGMGYVALSRLTRLEGLELLGLNKKALQVSPRAWQLDKILKKSSKKTAAFLKKLSLDEKKKRQKSFLDFLNPISQTSKNKPSVST